MYDGLLPREKKELEMIERWAEIMRQEKAAQEAQKEAEQDTPQPEEADDTEGEQ
jgi:hypothetical protein